MLFVSAPALDAVIVKATVSVGRSILDVSDTRSFVFARDNAGPWQYTEKFDERFAQHRL
jgi:hypothetical protein